MVEELEQIPKRPLLALVPFRRFHDLGESLVINIRAEKGVGQQINSASESCIWQSRHMISASPKLPNWTRFGSRVVPKAGPYHRRINPLLPRDACQQLYKFAGGSKFPRLREHNHIVYEQTFRGRGKRAKERIERRNVIQLPWVRYAVANDSSVRSLFREICSPRFCGSSRNCGCRR
jgi:hypothetical protein